MPIEIVGEAEPQREYSAPQTTSVQGDVIGPIAVAKAFDLEPVEVKKYESKINTILDWISEQTEDKSPSEIQRIIKELETRLGTPAFGENRVHRVSQYAFLELESRRIEKEKKALLHGSK